MIRTILVLLFCTILKASTLQEMYDNALPGEGYNKLIVLEKDSIYTGGFKQDVESVSIHGNGAVIDLLGDTISVIGSKKIDIDHCIFFSSYNSYEFISLADNSRGSIINNTFIGSLGQAYSGCCIFIMECNGTPINIINNIFTLFGTAVYYYTLYHEAEIIFNISNNDTWNCASPYEFWGGWTGAPIQISPFPGNQELTEDPKFVSPGRFDFSLKENSLCVDDGLYCGFEYKGNAPDIGAIESDYSRFIGTKISGELSEDLTKDKSPYLVVDDLIVPKDKKVEIHPGVTLKINNSKSIHVYGQLRINGSENDSVYITNNSSQYAPWGNIVFHKNSSSQSLIQYSVIEFGYFMEPYRCCISCNNDSLTILHSYFSNNRNAIYCDSGCRINISYNVFDEKSEFTGIYDIVCARGSKCFLTGNILRTAGVTCDSASLLLRFNKFMGQVKRMLQSYWQMEIRNHSNVYLESNYFQNNDGAINVDNSYCVSYNNLFNNGNYSFGFSNNSYGIICNNTIHFNGYYLISSSEDSRIDIYNSIVWNTDKTRKVFTSPDSTNINANYCLLSSPFPGTGNIVKDPLFEDVTANNFHLLSNSPCINAGVPDTTGLFLPYYDLDSNKRIIDKRIDIGCYESQIIDDITSDSKSVVKEYFLEQNFPNPFNPVTTISFNLPFSQKAEIKVYDMLGKEAAVLINEYMNAGLHDVKFNAGSLPSGVYFYRLIADGNIIQTKKLILLK